jgi:hypothetical protein
MDKIEGHHVKQCKPGSERQSPHVFSHMWEINIYTEQKWSYTNLYVEYGSIEWNYSMELGKEGKEKKMIKHQQYCKIQHL